MKYYNNINTILYDIVLYIIAYMNNNTILLILYSFKYFLKSKGIIYIYIYKMTLLWKHFCKGNFISRNCDFITCNCGKSDIIACN